MSSEAVRAEIDERRIARLVSLGLPLATVAMAVVAGITWGASLAILVLGAGGLLGVISLFWASLRILSGDATLPPELDALDISSRSVDALAARRAMLLRALKDLETERSLGKLDEDDFHEVAQNYRSDLKDVMRRIDDTLAPFRDQAEKLAAEHLAAQGVEEASPARTRESPPAAKKEPSPSAELICPQCRKTNDPDANFCKTCGATIGERAKR